MLAALIGFLGDFDLAEEAAQEAFAIAAERWPREGPPDNPAGWLLVTARNRAINRIRRERTLTEKKRLLENPPAPLVLLRLPTRAKRKWHMHIPFLTRLRRPGEWQNDIEQEQDTAGVGELSWIRTKEHHRR